MLPTVNAIIRENLLACTFNAKLSSIRIFTKPPPVSHPCNKRTQLRIQTRITCRIVSRRFRAISSDSGHIDGHRIQLQTVRRMYVGAKTALSRTRSKAFGFERGIVSSIAVTRTFSYRPSFVRAIFMLTSPLSFLSHPAS